MRELVYRAPDGGTIHNMPFEYLRKLLMDRSADYWNSLPGCGDAQLTESANENNLRLYWVYKEPHGFMMTYSDIRKEESLTAALSDEWKETTTYVLGGVDAEAPIAFFVPAELAVEIVKEFYETGRRYDKVTWIDIAREWP